MSCVPCDHENHKILNKINPNNDGQKIILKTLSHKLVHRYMIVSAFDHTIFNYSTTENNDKDFSESDDANAYQYD